MKTPRKLLLERHRSAVPKLDAIRNSTVAAVYDRRTLPRMAFASTILQNIWRELIWPCRRTWTALAAAWVLICVTNISMQDHSPSKMAKATPTPDMMFTFHQQQELLAQLIGQGDAPIAEPRKAYMPRPSSQRRFEIMTA